MIISLASGSVVGDSVAVATLVDGAVALSSTENVGGYTPVGPIYCVCDAVMMNVKDCSSLPGKKL